MRALLRLLGRGFRALGQLLLPVFGWARDWRPYSPVLRWGLHFLLIAAVLVLLTYLNSYFDLERVLRAPWPLLRRVWLPLLFVLVYGNVWLGVWLWRLLGPEKTGSEFPDLDAAWKDALEALDRAGIAIDRVPLFLILGQPPGQEADLFRASRLDFPVRPRATADAPVHVYANTEGIYVTCPGASLLARHDLLLAGAAEATVAQAVESVEGSAAGPPVEAARGVLGLASAEAVGPVLTVRAEPAAVARPPEPTRPAPAHVVAVDPAQAEELTARLQYLCHLVARERRPYCPVNGILLLAPLAALRTELTANQTGAVCEQELGAVEEVLQVECPVLVLVCGLEEAAGFADFLRRFPEENRDRRLGKALPYVSEWDRGSLPGSIEAAVAWICEGLLPPLVCRLLHLGRPEGPTVAEAVAGNRRLYQFLSQLRERRKPLTRLLLRASARNRGRAWLAGCYLAGTGRDVRTGQAFVAEVFRLLVENQNFVSWTPAALGEEAAYRRLSLLGYVGLGLFTAAVLVFGFVF